MDSNAEKRMEQFHNRVREELRSIPVPPALRARILAQRPRATLVAWSFWRPALGIAASVFLLATAILFWNRPWDEDKTFAGFQNRMTGYAVRQYSMDFFTRDLAEARSSLAIRGAPTDFQLANNLHATSVKGGAKLTWQGVPVAMLCFDGPRAKTLYLFVIDSDALHSPPPRQPTIDTTKGLSSAFWSMDGKTFLLAAELPTADLRSFL